MSKTLTKTVTVTEARLDFARRGTFSEKPKDQLSIYAQDLIRQDVEAVFEYRNGCDDTDSIVNFQKWFPYVQNIDEANKILKWLDQDRDFIYNSYGLRLLKNRYLKPNEPIQYCMLRLARLFSTKIENRVVDLEGWQMMYDAISCGFMHTSSILADADEADENIVPGEACRLVVCNPEYGRKFINQANAVCNLTSLGVGVGMSVSTVPLHGSKECGKIRSGFTSLAKKLDSCNYLTLYERKPKVALYIETHNDTIFAAFELRNPLKNNHLENVFIGLMVSDYFVECYENDQTWYLFPGDATLDGKNLCDYYGEEYKQLYKRFVDAKLYTRSIESSKMMDYLVTCISESGSPYVIFKDHVNEYSNHKHLGVIKTLNLCAEITNFASVEKSSSCTLMSVNCAMFKDFPQILKRLYKYIQRLSTFYKIGDDGGSIDDNYDVEYCDDYYDSEDADNIVMYCGLDSYSDDVLCKFVYMLGFLSTTALNIFMGDTRPNREIGVSPLGVFDMAIIANKDPVKIVSHISEALYKGCIEASCKHYQSYNVQCEYYKDSPFSKGIPQWKLRNEPVNTDWSFTLNLMKRGMANSMLTAQAPTATTSMLVGVIESVCFPMSIIMARESENGRNGVIAYGLLYHILNFPNQKIDLNNGIGRQLLMYQHSAPFIDQSQSTMFSLDMKRQNILNLIMEAYYAKLKTAIYYILPKQINDTLTIVKSILSSASQKRSLSDDDEEDTPNDGTTTTSDIITCQIDRAKRPRPNCDGCSG